jgi:hypothetical protein
MVTIIENWAEVVGEIRDALGDDSNPPFLILTVHLDQVTNHGKFPNLIRPNALNEIRVKLKHSEFSRLQLQLGSKIKAIMRAAPGGIYFVKPESLQRV